MPSTSVSQISPEEESKNVTRGRNDRAIAMIVESITNAIDEEKA